MQKIKRNEGLAAYKKTAPPPPPQESESFVEGEVEHKAPEAEVQNTVVKAMAGGSVPIIPPSPIVQLQPIVVPIAVVPFETRDAKILQNVTVNSGQTAARPQGQTAQSAAYAQYAGGAAAHGAAARAAKSAGGKKLAAVKNAVITLLALLYLLPFVLAYFTPSLIPSFVLTDLNVVGKMLGFLGGVAFNLIGEIPFILLAAACGFALILVLINIITLFFGKYLRFGALVLSIFPLLLALFATVYAYIPALGFVAWNKGAFFIPTTIGLIQTVLSIVFLYTGIPKIKIAEAA